jgi:hypothetical protein
MFTYPTLKESSNEHKKEILCNLQLFPTDFIEMSQISVYTGHAWA